MTKNESFLMIVSVYQEKWSEDVLVALTESGVKDILTLTGANETRRLPQNIPLFAGFKNSLGKTSPMSKIFLGVVNDSEIPKAVLANLKHADIDFLGEDLGSILLLPLYAAYLPS